MIDRKDIPLYSKRNKKSKDLQNKDAGIYPQGKFKDKPCRWCDSVFSPCAPSEHYCSDDCKDQAVCDNLLHTTYGISITNYQDLFISQDGKCAVCKSSGFKIDEKTHVSLVIDHDHLTGKVRGLLCHNCNRALGLLKDDPETITKALEYIEKPELILELDNRDRLKRTRKKKVILSKDTLSLIYTDWFINKLRTMQIVTKYGITKETVKNITSGYTHANELKIFRESVTTIPEGSTSQANGDGSGLPLTDNAEGDDIVSSV